MIDDNTTHGSPSALLFEKKLGRSRFLRALGTWPLRSLLHRSGKLHIADGRRQLVVFAFDHIGHSINLDGVYERDDLEVFFEWLGTLGVDGPRGLALDIGANIGNHSLFFSDHFDRVVSFEPNPRTFKVLSLNAELAGNVTCMNVGLSDAAGEAVLRLNPSNIGGSSISTGSSGPSVTIRLETLDSLLPDLANLRLIKIDVEGHELAAIRGAAATIRRHRPIVLFEQHLSDFKDGASPVVSELQVLGYRCFASLRKYPRPTAGKLGSLLVVIRRALFGESAKIRLESTLVPSDYNFIMALPDWCIDAATRASGRR